MLRLKYFTCPDVQIQVIQMEVIQIQVIQIQVWNHTSGNNLHLNFSFHSWVTKKVSKSKKMNQYEFLKSFSIKGVPFNLKQLLFWSTFIWSSLPSHKTSLGWFVFNDTTLIHPLQHVHQQLLSGLKECKKPFCYHSASIISLFLH